MGQSRGEIGGNDNGGASESEPYFYTLNPWPNIPNPTPYILPPRSSTLNPEPWIQHPLPLVPNASAILKTKSANVNLTL